MAERRTLRGKKLLVATIGLATASVAGCGSMTSGNLVAPLEDAGVDAGPSDAGPSDAGADEGVREDAARDGLTGP